MKNFIFFDIDGTIISEDGYLPESAVRAIQAARKKGNATLINTGRTAMNVDPFLREIGFDGYIYGCGTELEYDGKVLFHEKQTPARSREMVELVRRTNVAVLYERSDAIFIDRKARTLPNLQSSTKASSCRSPMCRRMGTGTRTSLSSGMTAKAIWRVSRQV